MLKSIVSALEDVNTKISKLSKRKIYIECVVQKNKWSLILVASDDYHLYYRKFSWEILIN